MLHALDWFFVLFHGSLVLFNLFGWMHPATRRLHLLTISLTLLSWFGLGVYYGWGYCPCTDWHWQVKRALGETNLPVSYVKYYLDRLTPWTWNADLVDVLVVATTLAAFGLSIWLNVRDRQRRREAKQGENRT